MLQSVISPLKIIHEPFCSLTLTQSIQTGIKDSVTPYVLSATLFFVLLLYCIKKDKLPRNTFSAFFIGGYVLSTFGLIFGTFDVFLNNLLFTQIVRIGNLILGLIFVWVGLINLRDWWRLKKHDAFNQLVVKSILFFSDETTQGKKVSWFRIQCIRWGAFLWGMLAALLGSAWGPDKDLFVMIAYLIKGNNQLEAYWGIGIYSLVQSWLLFFVWFLTAYIRLSDSSQAWIEKNISFIKIIGAAIFISIGSGISYLSIK